MSNSVDLFSLLSKPSSVSPRELSPSDEPESSPSQELFSEFQSVLTHRLSQVEQTQIDAQNKMRDFAAGNIENVHDVTVALQKATMAVNLTTLVRRKFLDAWEQLQTLR